MLQRVEHGRYNGRNDHIVYIRHFESLVREQLIDDHSILIGALVVICFNSPVGQQISVFEYAKYDIAVSNVKS